eukprot:CAMPEP_0184339108 /NCGR_PEP_ID=MMETSP1089-20130417/7792_1 /TAXON_ID=38269 ORGANISM="Gloeochaete wittrockiana, Strain SAG46.84" /NCGR_SAMPLE_ID=MMETSP1089 /ASSEMBLY_ACC=CAM_ASM_000445 /LENGTH=75 /DNA_ID=CAMNT_0026666179 /DNA_START=162 /DNA_END=389 /DNA_ORIENTATION=-
MGSTIKIKKGGVEVEETTRVLDQPVVRVLCVAAVLDHEDPELVHALQLHIDLGHDVVVASESDVLGVGLKDGEGD